MKKQIRSIVIASALAVTASHAATISWSAAPTSNSGSGEREFNTPGDEFQTSGTQFLAQNLGGAAFTATANPDGIVWAAGTIDFGGTTSAAHTTIASTYNEVSRTATVGGTGAQTVSLTGLTDTQTYRIQLLFIDGTGPQNGRHILVDGVDQGQHSNGVSGSTWGEGLIVTGTFTANATSQDFTVLRTATDGTTADGGFLNAIVVHSVPEPSSTALLGLGGLALILRRRK